MVPFGCLATAIVGVRHHTNLGDLVVSTPLWLGL